MEVALCAAAVSGILAEFEREKMDFAALWLAQKHGFGAACSGCWQSLGGPGPQAGVLSKLALGTGVQAAAKPVGGSLGRHRQRDRVSEECERPVLLERTFPHL